jgi:hypothetical protein
MRSSLQGLPVQSMEILTIEQLRKAWARSEHVEFADPALARPFHLTEKSIRISVRDRDKLPGGLDGRRPLGWFLNSSLTPTRSASTSE